MTPSKTDCGLAVVEHYFSLLKIDEKSCVRESRGFTWWAEDLAQRIWSDPPVVREGAVSWKIHARTDLLSGFIGTGSNLSFLNELAGFPSLGGGMILDASHSDKVRFAACVNTTEDSFEWAKAFFPSTAATQAGEAHQLAHIAPAMTECSADYGAHPSAGPAERHADVFALLGSHIREGKQPPVWTPEDFDEAVDDLESEPYPVFTSESGLTAYFPFRDSTALGEMSTAPGHPSYGNGLRVRLVLPYRLSDEDDPGIALRWNRFEIESMTGVGHFTGSYYADDEAFIYSNFIPNLSSYRRVPFLTSLVRFLALRARWLETAEEAVERRR